MSMNKISSILKTLRFITSHPLNKDRKLASIRRFICWQMGSRLVPGTVALNFVDESRLLVSPGMTGATGNVYTGLHEFEDMAFVLHVLREHDLFVDVGANIGSYSVLAGAVAKANCIAFEPIPATHRQLLNNIHLNAIHEIVEARNIGIGRENGELKFTVSLDTVNHVACDTELGVPTLRVPVETLDDALSEKRPTIIKIDVEGFETNVIEGSTATLSRDSLLAVVMELNGSGSRYGFDEAALHRKMLACNFQSFTYSPFDRKLISLEGKNRASGNTIYIKDEPQVRNRLESARAFSVNGRSI